jgi:PPOX class probable F420-dependent enzyme
MVSDVERRFLAHQRIAHLATADRRAVPHVVPVCFAIRECTLYITIDEKPKRRPGTALKRLRNIAENPAVAVVVDRYDEDWARLGWVMLRGHAEILNEGTEHRDAQALLVPAIRSSAPCRLQIIRSSPFASSERQAGATCPEVRRLSRHAVVQVSHRPKIASLPPRRGHDV